MRRLLAALLVSGLAACAGAPKKSAPSEPVAAATPTRPAASDGRKVSPYAAAQEDPNTRGDYVAGGLYKPGVDDSTPDYVPDVDAIPEPEVVALPRSKVGNRASYNVLGKTYRVMDDQRGYVEQGQASYYGKKFHGRRTSNLEVYDMYAFTAAHKSLPLPSFARVTNLANGKSVVVRVNDRGPFHEGRVIDLSYAAAVKLDYIRNGTARVEVRALMPGDPDVPMYVSATPVSVAPVAAAPPSAAISTTAMDQLVAAIPVASAGAVALPPGVRIATGKPARPTPAVPVATSANTVANTAAVETSTAAPAESSLPGQDYRFDMRQDGQAMTADQFESWMQSRQVRVATGRPGQPVNYPAVAAVPAQAEPPPPPVRAAALVAASTGSSSASDPITLQVAAFSARGNADRALAMMRGAGIDGARLLDAHADGRTIWRLRVGPLAAAAAPALAARIVGLGFGQPQRVLD